MAGSLVYAGIFGAVLASLRAISASMVVFSDQVVDLSADLHDPVDLLFGLHLAGGTNIHKALTYCQQRIERPERTIFVLLTDLYEGGDTAAMVGKAKELVQSGFQVICLLALSDEGRPSFHRGNAQTLANMGIPVFACTPELFADLMSCAISRGDMTLWAASHEIVSVPALTPSPANIVR